MKFSTYQPQVNPNTTNAREIAVSNPLAYGEGGKGMQALSGAFGQMAKVAGKIQDENDAADVAAARAEISQAINQSLYSEDGIITTGKGKNYEGLADRVNTSITDITNDVASNYNGRVSKILREKYLPGDLTNYGKMAMQAENNERNKYLDTQYNSLLTNDTKVMCSNYGNPDLIESTRKEIDEAVNSRALRLGWDGSTVMAEKRAVWTNAVESVMNTCVSNDDFESAKGYLEKYKKDLDPDVYSKWHKAINERQKNNDDYMFVQNNISKVWHDGHIDYEAVDALVDEYVNSSGGGGNSQEGVMAGFKAFEGQRMPHGDRGCVEGVVRIGSYYSPWLQKHQEQNNVDDLIAAAKNEPDGPEVIAFNENSLNPGDVIVYADSRNETQHVVIYAGGTSYVGNSSRQQRIVQGSDYREMDDLHPYQIIKTGGSGTAKAGLNYDPKRKEQLKNMFLAQAGYRQKIYQEEQSRIAESFIDRFNSGNEDPATLAYEINNSGLSPVNKKRLINSITGRSGAGRRSGSSANYANDGTKITASKVASMRKKVERYNYYLERGENVPAGVQFEADEASRWLIENGLAEGGAILGGNDGKTIWSAITDMKESGKSNTEIKQELISAGASESMANWYIDNIEE